MSYNPGFERLAQVFSQFAAKYNPTKLQTKVPEFRKGLMKEVALIAIEKDGLPSQNDFQLAAIRAVQKFITRANVEEFVSDVYNLVQGQEFSEAVSQVVQNLDTTQLTEAADKFTEALKNPQTTQSLAAQLKLMAGTTEFYQFKEQMKMVFGGSNMPPMGQQVFDTVMDNIEPIYTNAKDQSVQEIADQIGAAMDALPFDQVIQQVLAVSYLVTPEVVSDAVKKQMSSLPSPQQAGDLYDTTMSQLTGRTTPPANTNKPPKPPKQNGGNGGFKF